MSVGLVLFHWLHNFFLDFLVAAILIFPILILSFLFILPFIALLDFLHLELPLVIRVLLILLIVFLPILNIIQVALFLLLLRLGIGMDLVEEEVASSLDLLQDVGRYLILPHHTAIDGDFLYVCQLADDDLPFLLGETSLL